MSVGRVTLVGGGPGRADLLTVAAVRALANADVVLYDRLAPHATLPELAPKARLIDVGKRPGHHAVGQDSIEDIMIAHAREGLDVVRLKGGDPFVFGRGGEEVQACRRAGIDVEVIPGVTSAVAVPGAAGIAITFREVSRMFTVVSGHMPLSDDEHRHLAGLDSTIVVLMGVSTLPSLTYGLTRHGLPESTPVAIVERGYSPEQRSIFSTLGSVIRDAAAAHVSPPAVLVIGQVVALADRGDALSESVLHAAGAFATAGTQAADALGAHSLS